MATLEISEFNFFQFVKPKSVFIVVKAAVAPSINFQKFSVIFNSIFFSKYEYMQIASHNF